MYDVGCDCRQRADLERQTVTHKSRRNRDSFRAEPLIIFEAVRDVCEKEKQKAKGPSYPIFSQQVKVIVMDFDRIIIDSLGPKFASIKQVGAASGADGGLQLELLDRLIPELEAEIARFDKEPASIEERRKRTDEAVATRTEVLTASQKEISDHEERRREAWQKAKQLERQQATTVELRRRFTFLEE